MKIANKVKTRNSQICKAPESCILPDAIRNVRADIAEYSAEYAKPENREAGKKPNYNIALEAEFLFAREEPVLLSGIRNLDVFVYRNSYWVNLDRLCAALDLDAKTERAKVQNDPDFIFLYVEDDGFTLEGDCSGDFCIDALQVCGWLFTINRTCVSPEYQIRLTMVRRQLQAAVNASCAVLKSSATVDRDAERRLKELLEVSGKQTKLGADLMEVSGKQTKLAAELRSLCDQMTAKPVRAEHADREAELWMHS